MKIKLNIIGSGCTCDVVEDLNTLKTLLESPTIQAAKEPQTMTIQGAVLLTVIKILLDEDTNNTPSN